ncbi:hypothetical protein ACQZV8_10185 [Magnetococcales bacterium HHB-1]
MCKNLKIYSAISGHGFGHIGQVAAILHCFRQKFPTSSLIVASRLKREVVHRLIPDARIISQQQDVALVQPTPLEPDIEATRLAMRAWMKQWPEQVKIEQEQLKEIKPDLILADIPCLIIEAATALSIPTLAIASLSWDQILPAYLPPENDPEVKRWLKTMRHAYRQVTLALKPEPAMESDPFIKVQSISPLHIPGRSKPQALRRDLEIHNHDPRPLILVSLGGVPATELPIDALIQQTDFLWLVDFHNIPKQKHLFALRDLPQWRFADISASVDGVVGKPGYGMSVDAAINKKPFLYRRRGHFPDEPSICAWLSQHARALELDAETFNQGQWSHYLKLLFAQKQPPAPRADGAEEAVEIICRYLNI